MTDTVPEFETRPEGKIPGGGLILEIGCGTKRVVPDSVGLDIYPFPGVDVVRDLRRGLPWSAMYFHGVVAHHVLEHFAGEDLVFVVEEMHRVTKPGGILRVVVPDATSPNRYRDPTHLTRDWSPDSFDLWANLDERGEYRIFVGPMYQRRAKLMLEQTWLTPSKDRGYVLRVL